jgi:hypothetical protein
MKSTARRRCRRRAGEGASAMSAPLAAGGRERAKRKTTTRSSAVLADRPNSILPALRADWRVSMGSALLAHPIGQLTFIGH